uniref:Uncharacterized protein n=2 Tax=Hucho hucho TaxID=62062 RepID=A0A4W5MPJ5_9TELE
MLIDGMVSQSKIIFDLYYTWIECIYFDVDFSSLSAFFALLVHQHLYCFPHSHQGIITSMELLQKIKTDFLLCEREKEDALEFLGQIEKIVSKHCDSKIPLAKPKSYELRIGGLEDTVHAGDGEQLEVWKDCYLPERMEMVVIGALDDFRCSAAGWQLVLLLCEDGNVYAYEFEVLHLVATSLEDLFKSGAEFPGLEKFRFGECFEELTEEEMQCDEIKKIDDEHMNFRRKLEIEMLEDLKAISQSEFQSTIQPNKVMKNQVRPDFQDLSWQQCKLSRNLTYQMPLVGLDHVL